MCGIAGFTMLHRAVANAPELVARMADALAARGPDGRGIHAAGPVALGHRRLSIIDPAGGAQPMASPDGRLHLVCNGEIYNYVELRQQREARGDRFATHSDTEVLLHELAADSRGALPRLDGMFALACWDAERQELLLARDRFGVKPLYYAIRNGDLVFASEPRALLLHPLISREIDPQAVQQFFTHHHIPSPRSIYRDIRKLEPGHFLVFGPRGLHQHAAYVAPPLRDPAAPAPSLADAARDVRQLLRQAVRRQLRSDVPVGVFLSGGIDSSSLTALAAQESPAPLHTFSIGFPEASFDESAHALAVARHCGTLHHHEILHSDQALALLPAALEALDEPFGDPSFLPTFFLSRLARQTVKVALGGEGGDELFGGYPAFQAHVLMEAFERLPPGIQAGLDRWIQALPVTRRYAGAGALLRLFLHGRGLPPEDRFLVWMGSNPPATADALLSPELRETLRGPDVFANNPTREPPDANAFDRLQATALHGYLEDGVLDKVDRASMAHGLEVRVPLLDPALADYVARLPPRYKMDLFQTKIVFKKALRGLLPPRILRRRKAGFMFPLDAWLSGNFLPLLRDLCAEDTLRRQGWLDPAQVRTLLDDHLEGRANHGRRLWSLLVFQHWLARHESP